MDRRIESLEDLRKRFAPLENVNEVHRQKFSKLDKLALFVTTRVGTMQFFLLILCWTVIWLGWNMFAPANWRFDPFPAFVFWLFLSNMVQIFLMPLIMVGQNLQGRHAELRSEHDFETNKKAEHEIETILLHLENQHRLMNQVLKRIEDLEKTKT